MPEEIRVSEESELPKNVNFSVEDVNVSSEVVVGDKKPKCSTRISLNEKRVGDVVISASAEIDVNKKDISLSSQNVDVAYENNNTVVDTQLQNSKQEASALINFKKLINADNINNLENNDKCVKEQLVDRQERIAISTKVGLDKKTKSFFNENSLLYRINDNNFLKSNYKYSGNEQNFGIDVDLKNVKIGCSNNSLNNEESLTNTNLLSVELKGKKNQYMLNVSDVKTTPKNTSETDTQGTTHENSLNFQGIFNRSEYGEFNDGFNSAVDVGLIAKNGKVNGWHSKVDVAFNKYGAGKNNDTDYLLRTKLNLSKDDVSTNFKTSLMGAYRVDNCRMIYEPDISFTGTNNNNSKSSELSSSLGVYRQLGRNFEDITVFAKGDVGKLWTDNGSIKTSSTFAEINFGSKVKVFKNATLGSNISYHTSNKWSGNINATVSF